MIEYTAEQSLAHIANELERIRKILDQRFPIMTITPGRHVKNKEIEYCNTCDGAFVSPYYLVPAGEKLCMCKPSFEFKTLGEEDG